MVHDHFSRHHLVSIAELPFKASFGCIRLIDSMHASRTSSYNFGYASEEPLPPNLTTVYDRSDISRGR